MLLFDVLYKKMMLLPFVANSFSYEYPDVKYPGSFKNPAPALSGACLTRPAAHVHPNSRQGNR